LWGDGFGAFGNFAAFLFFVLFYSRKWVKSKRTSSVILRNGQFHRLSFCNSHSNKQYIRDEIDDSVHIDDFVIDGILEDKMDGFWKI
jgi:hypothetical protein